MTTEEKIALRHRLLELNQAIGRAKGNEYTYPGCGNYWEAVIRMPIDKIKPMVEEKEQKLKKLESKQSRRFRRSRR